MGWLLIAVTVIGFATWLEHARAAREATEEAGATLRLIAEGKAAQLVNWREERLGDARFMARVPDLARSVHALLADPASPSARAGVAGWLNLIETNHRDAEVALLGPDFALIASASRPPKIQDERLLAQLKSTAASRRITVSDLHRDPDGSGAHVDIVIPILGLITPEDEAGEKPPPAYLLFHIDAADYLLPVLQRWPGTSATGEIILVRQEGNDLVHLNDLRHYPRGQPAPRLAMTDPALADALLEDPQPNVFSGRDYRGVMSVTAFMPLAGTDWLLGAKLDQSEIAGIWGRSVGESLALAIACSLAAAGAIGWFGRHRESVLLRAEVTAAAALRESEERFRQLTDTIDGAVWMATPNGSEVLFVSPAYERIWGRSREELATRPFAWLEATHPEDRERMAQALARQTETGRIDQTFRILRPDGTLRWIHTRAFPVRNAAGEIYRVAGLADDITERRQLEMARIETEERFTAMFQAAPVAISLATFDGRLIDVNPHFCARSGYGRDELVGQNVGDIGLWADPGERLALVERLRRERSVRNEDVLFRCKSGELRTNILSMELLDLSDEPLLLAMAVDITERKQLEAAVASREKQLASFFAGATAGLELLDADLRFVRVNETLAEMHGLPAKEHIGRTIAEVLPGLAPKLVPAFQRVLATGEPVERLEICGEMPDRPGITRHWLGSLFPFNGNGGAPEGVGAIVVEITDRKLAEEALARERTLLRTLIDHIPDVIYVKDADSRFVLANESVAALVGVDAPAKLLGRTDAEFFSAEIAAGFRADEQRVLAGSFVLDQEETIVRPGADDRVLLTTKLPLRDDRGEIVGVVGVGRDITEGKRAAEILRESEQRFRQLAENVHEVFWIAEPDHSRMLYVNPIFEKIWGRSCESVLRDATTWIEGVHPDDRARVCTALMSEDSGLDYDETFRVLRPDGTIRWVRDRAFPVRDASGRICRLVGIAEDITERRELEEQVRQSQKLEAIGTLAGGIAHDFNNILATISGFTALARMPSTRRADVEDYLGEVARASDRATALVRQILAFGRRQEQQRVPLSLAPVINETVKLLRATIPSTIEFQLELAADAPLVLADATQIHQVVMNLGTNAWHAMRERGGVLRIEFARCEVDASFASIHPQLRPGPHVRLSIRDTGHGMDAATCQRIFEPFFTTKPPGEGTGLGLAVVHGIVSSHEGVVTVASEPGAGTGFHLYFPAFDGTVTAAPRERATLPAGRGERILIVDDEEPIARMVALLLRGLGYVPDSHFDAATALASFRAAPDSVALVITDQTMPKMTGLELAAEITRINPRLPIVLMSGYSPSLSPDRIRAAGVRELLMKPASMNSLGVTVHRLLHPSDHH